MKFKIGDKVWTGVFVNNEWQRMAGGVVVGMIKGCYEVDVMSHHGGAPWIRLEDENHLELREEPTK